MGNRLDLDYFAKVLKFKFVAIVSLTLLCPYILEFSLYSAFSLLPNYTSRIGWCKHLVQESKQGNLSSFSLSIVNVLSVFLLTWCRRATHYFGFLVLVCITGGIP